MPDDDDVADGAGDLLSWRHISEIYYLWKLAGGDLEGSLRKAGLIRQYPPITQLPSSVVPFCLHFVNFHLCPWQAVLLTLCVGYQAEHQVSKTSWFSNSQRFSFGTFWGSWSNPSLSLRFNGHFPGEPGLASVYWSKGWWKWWWQLDYCSYKSCKAPVKSSPPTNQHPVFLQAGCPSCHPTNSVKALKGKYLGLQINRVNVTINAINN